MADVPWPRRLIDSSFDTFRRVPVGVLLGIPYDGLGCTQSQRRCTPVSQVACIALASYNIGGQVLRTLDRFDSRFPRIDDFFV